jgi:hypothetical protein
MPCNTWITECVLKIALHVCLGDFLIRTNLKYLTSLQFGTLLWKMEKLTTNLTKINFGLNDNCFL